MKYQNKVILTIRFLISRIYLGGSRYLSGHDGLKRHGNLNDFNNLFDLKISKTAHIQKIYHVLRPMALYLLCRQVVTYKTRTAERNGN